MIRALGRFVEALRREGLAASPAEAVDAGRAVEAVGVENRDRFRAALGATLAKGVRDREVFDRLFDRFFAPPPRGGGRKGESSEGSGAGGAGSSGTGAGRSRPDPQSGVRPRSAGRVSGTRSGRAIEGRERVRALVAGSRSASTRSDGRLRAVRLAPRVRGESADGPRGEARLLR